MADFDRIKRNLKKMIDAGAPEDELDGYVASEGVTAEQLRNASKTTLQMLGDSTVGDVVQSATAGITRGAAGLVGLPGEAARLMRWGASKAGIASDDPDYIEQRGKFATMGTKLTPTTEQVLDTIKPVTGELHEPKTTAGKYARTIGEFVPAAVAGPGNALRNIGWFAGVPGVASEAAGQATEGTVLEPYARVGGALGGLGATALLRRPGTAGEVMGESLAGLDPAVINQAARLVDDAAARGITLTWPEAIQQVTNSGTSLANLQRVVEGSQQGGAVRHVMAERPGQVQHAFDQQMAEIAAVPMRPYTVGPQIAQASEEAINATRQQINRIAEPHYARAATARVPARTMDTLRHLPGWDEALDAVRNNPQLARYVEGLPDDSVGVLNEVKKYLNQRSRNVASVTDPNRNMQQSAGYGRDADAVRDAGRRTSGEYGRALDIEERMRRGTLEPMQAGPLGRAADAGTTEGALNALLPKSPLPNTAAETGRVFGELAGRAPRATANVVRMRVEQGYHQAARDLVGGSHQWGGAMTRARLVGDRQLRRNLRAAMQQLPNGAAVTRGFERLMDIFQATGRRQAVGSQTEFNRLITERLKGGGIPGEALSGAAGKINPLAAIRDRYQQWRMGRNVEDLAQLMIDPNARERLIALSRYSARTPRGAALAAELTSQLLSGTMEGTPRLPAP
jgi:hypothetical protein